jgi:hypothetical protein
MLLDSRDVTQFINLTQLKRALRKLQTPESYFLLADKTLLDLNLEHLCDLHAEFLKTIVDSLIALNPDLKPRHYKKISGLGQYLRIVRAYGRFSQRGLHCAKDLQQYV